MMRNKMTLLIRTMSVALKIIAVLIAIPIGGLGFLALLGSPNSTNAPLRTSLSGLYFLLIAFGCLAPTSGSTLKIKLDIFT
jgi:hypothetical protein